MGKLSQNPVWSQGSYSHCLFPSNSCSPTCFTNVLFGGTQSLPTKGDSSPWSCFTVAWELRGKRIPAFLTSPAHPIKHCLRVKCMLELQRREGVDHWVETGEDCDRVPSGGTAPEAGRNELIKAAERRLELWKSAPSRSRPGFVDHLIHVLNS